MDFMENVNTAIDELSMIPYNYSLEQSNRNKDIIYDQIKSYHVIRLKEFIHNMELGISDKVRIVKFVFDGKVTTAILQYNGDILEYTIDVSRFHPDLKFITYIGFKMFSHTEHHKKKEIEVYYLITNTHEVVEVFIDA